MTSCQRETESRFGEQDVEYVSPEVANDERLLHTKLTCATPQNEGPEPLSYHKSVEQCNSLSLSYSHSFTYAHSPTNGNDSPTYQALSPQYSVPTVDYISSPLAPALDELRSSNCPRISELKHWLAQFKIEDICPKLIAADFNSIDVFLECDDDDIKRIANETGLSTSQRLKLKQAIRSLKSGESANTINPAMYITEKEQRSMMEMKIFRENVEECIRVIEQKHNDLEPEKQCKEAQITKEFDLMISALIERRITLMRELHLICEQKKENFEQRLIELRRVSENIRNAEKECGHLLRSQSVISYEIPFKHMAGVENEIHRISETCVNAIAPINVNTKIKVQLKTNDIIQIMNVMGDVQEDRACRAELSYDPRAQYRNKHKSKAHYYHALDDTPLLQEEDEEEELREIESTEDEEDPQVAMLWLRKVSEISEEKRHNRKRKHSRSKPRKRRKSTIPVADEWSKCGDNLKIAPEIHSASNKITNIGRTRDNNHCYKGSGFGSAVVYRGTHFWKIQVSCSNSYRTAALNNFAIGFVAKRYGSRMRNSWFLTHEKSIGIYSDKQIWCNGKKVSSSEGIAMEHKDIINIALDIDDSALYVQRCKYNANRREHDVYAAQQIPLIRNAIHSNEGYRLGCYLRQKRQSITILDYDIKPFEEWR